MCTTVLLNRAWRIRKFQYLHTGYEKILRYSESLDGTPCHFYFEYPLRISTPCVWRSTWRSDTGDIYTQFRDICRRSISLRSSSTDDRAIFHEPWDFSKIFSLFCWSLVFFMSVWWKKENSAIRWNKIRCNFLSKHYKNHKKTNLFFTKIIKITIYKFLKILNNFKCFNLLVCKKLCKITIFSLAYIFLIPRVFLYFISQLRCVWFKESYNLIQVSNRERVRQCVHARINALRSAWHFNSAGLPPHATELQPYRLFVFSRSIRTETRGDVHFGKLLELEDRILPPFLSPHSVVPTTTAKSNPISSSV